MQIRYVGLPRPAGSGEVKAIFQANESSSPIVYEWTEKDWCNDIVDHSPTGVTWGYNGSGPSQMALAVLVSYLVNRFGYTREFAGGVAKKYYMKFREEFIAPAPMNETLVIQSKDIDRWLLQVLIDRLTRGE